MSYYVSNLIQPRIWFLGSPWWQDFFSFHSLFELALHHGDAWPEFWFSALDETLPFESDGGGGLHKRSDSVDIRAIWRAIASGNRRRNDEKKWRRRDRPRPSIAGGRLTLPRPAHHLSTPHAHPPTTSSSLTWYRILHLFKYWSLHNPTLPKLNLT